MRHLDQGPSTSADDDFGLGISRTELWIAASAAITAIVLLIVCGRPVLEWLAT
jgi:hypothetical protein